MKQVILTKGLPASGKSTWAKKLIDKNPGMYKRVNKDDIRDMLDNNKWSKSNEKFVLTIRDSIILSALEDGKHVIVDDTNLHPKHELNIKKLVKGKANVVVEDFTIVSPKTCIKRDLKRHNSVGSDVIMNMYDQFIKPEPVVYVGDKSLPPAVIIDIDGTLADMGDRKPFDWEQVGEDKLNFPVWDLLESTDNEIILLSGRDSICRAETIKWLNEHSVVYDKLYMRAENDNRKDTIIKKELFDIHVRDNYNVVAVVDDRPSVCRMWRDEVGLFVFQVGNPHKEF
jgi:predicted kinase